MKLILAPLEQWIDDQLFKISEDKTMLLINGDKDMTVTVECPDAIKVAKEIACSVNYYDTMVSVMKIFASDQLGGRLIEYIEASSMPHDGVEKLKRLINTVDVILTSIEIMGPNNGG